MSSSSKGLADDLGKLSLKGSRSNAMKVESPNAHGCCSGSNKCCHGKTPMNDADYQDWLHAVESYIEFPHLDPRGAKIRHCLLKTSPHGAYEVEGCVCDYCTFDEADLKVLNAKWGPGGQEKYKRVVDTTPLGPMAAMEAIMAHNRRVMSRREDESKKDTKKSLDNDALWRRAGLDPINYDSRQKKKKEEEEKMKKQKEEEERIKRKKEKKKAQKKKMKENRKREKDEEEKESLLKKEESEEEEDSDSDDYEPQIDGFGDFMEALMWHKQFRHLDPKGEKLRRFFLKSAPHGPFVLTGCGCEFCTFDISVYDDIIGEREEAEEETESEEEEEEIGKEGHLFCAARGAKEDLGVFEKFKSKPIPVRNIDFPKVESLRAVRSSTRPPRRVSDTRDSVLMRVGISPYSEDYDDAHQPEGTPSCCWSHVFHVTAEEDVTVTNDHGMLHVGSHPSQFLASAHRTKEEQADALSRALLIVAPQQIQIWESPARVSLRYGSMAHRPKTLIFWWTDNMPLEAVKTWIEFCRPHAVHVFNREKYRDLGADFVQFVQNLGIEELAIETKDRVVLTKEELGSLKFKTLRLWNVTARRNQVIDVLAAKGQVWMEEDGKTPTKDDWKMWKVQPERMERNAIGGEIFGKTSIKKIKKNRFRCFNAERGVLLKDEENNRELTFFDDFHIEKRTITEGERLRNGERGDGMHRTSDVCPVQ